MIVSLRSPMFSRSPKAPAYGELGSTHAPLSAPVMRKFCASGSTGGNVAVGVGVGAASVTAAAVAAGGEPSVATAAVSTPPAPAAVAAAPAPVVALVAAPAVVVAPAMVVGGVVVVAAGEHHDRRDTGAHLGDSALGRVLEVDDVALAGDQVSADECGGDHEAQARRQERRGDREPFGPRAVAAFATGRVVGIVAGTGLRCGLGGRRHGRRHYPGAGSRFTGIGPA